MLRREELVKRLLNRKEFDFKELAIDVFEYQKSQNPLYRKFVQQLYGDNYQVSSLSKIPFLPISFFKSHMIKSGDWQEEAIFRSSATTGMTRSSHFIRSQELYLSIAQQEFEKFYGSLSDMIVFALLPGYLERKDSSLVSMVDRFIRCTENEASGFYLDEIDSLIKNIKKARSSGKKILLIGVSFALLALADLKHDLHGVIVMETGGMKGRSKEMPKAVFHQLLMSKLNVSQIHSEYGMTELQSQAYSHGETIFKTSSTMKVMVADLLDPLAIQPIGKSGTINVIDLVNLDSCSFIATEDLGICLDEERFQILGRVDASEIRGCNLMLSDF